MRHIFLPAACLLVACCQFLGAPEASAQTSEEPLPLYYSVARNATLYSAPDSARPYVQLRFREQVFLVEEEAGGWSRVRTRDGAQGFIASRVLSNVWIRVSKSRQMLYLYSGTELIKKFPADFGQNIFADKEKRGSTTEPDHWRTPVGVFFIANKNPRSKFYKALVINYPTAEDAERGLRQEIITQAQYESIVRAEQAFQMPPMNTALGGWIEIHGRGTGIGSNWTQGCVAVHDDHIDELWQWTHVGTPVLIEP